MLRQRMSEILYQAPRISPEEYEKYRGRHVALYDERIIVDGSSFVKVLERAMKLYPKLRLEQIALFLYSSY